MPKKKLNNNLMEIYRSLYAQYGPQHWWPAKTCFEMAVGAILTQNTNWSNVEKAIANLDPYLQPQALHSMDDALLADLIHPCGYYNVKTSRLKSFLDWFRQFDYDFTNLRDGARQSLLGVKGIGRETADSILLYAAGIPVFVIDAYTRRLFGRLGIFPAVPIPDDYDELQALFEVNLDKEAALFNEYHALIVRHCKQFCRKAPLCADGCPLRQQCKYTEGSSI